MPRTQTQSLWSCIEDGSLAFRSLPAGVGFKPPSAATFERRGGERLRERRLLIERQVGTGKMSASEPLPRDKGTPQGGVISPLLMNLFMHYAFDQWMQRTHPHCPFARYADDAVVHCHHQAEAERLLMEIRNRLQDCLLTMHHDKSRVVYCKDSNRSLPYPQTQFTFLGFTFRPRVAVNPAGKRFTSFLPAVSVEAMKRMRQTIKGWNLNRQTFATLERLAHQYDPILRGWWNYYGCFYKTEMRALMDYFNQRLVTWARRKHKKLKGHKRRRFQWLRRVAKARPRLFFHW